MAGTPTTNYSIPTYADTDAPDLSGAYNDAMSIIDTQLKANADATAAKQDKLTAGAGIEIQGNEISATATGGKTYTAGNGIVISDTTISNKQATHVDSTNIADIESGNIPADYIGGVKATATNADVIERLAAIDDEEHGYAGAAVPTVKALKGYVEQKMAAAEAAYTGTAPIVVDNESHTISADIASAATVSDDTASLGRAGVNYIVNTKAVYDWVKTHSSDLSKPDNWSALYNAPVGVGTLISATPDASTSVKGLVLLVDVTGGNMKADVALTPRALDFGHRDDTGSVLTVQQLSQLRVNKDTGLVYLYTGPTD